MFASDLRGPGTGLLAAASAWRPHSSSCGSLRGESLQALGSWGLSEGQAPTPPFLQEYEKTRLRWHRSAKGNNILG